MDGVTLVETLPEDEQQSLARLAMLLAGDETAGINLLARSAVHTPDHEDAIDAQDYALETARRRLVRTYLAGKGGLGDQKIKRAAVALCFFGDLSVAETARALDLSADRVVAVTLAAAAIEGDLHQTWAQVLEKSPDTAELISEIHRQRRQAKRSRRRAGILITIAALIMAIGVIVPTVVLPRLPHTAHQAGEWTFVHTVEPPQGWSIAGRTVGDTAESTFMVSQGATDSAEETQCQITLFSPGGSLERLGYDPATYPGEDFRVDGRTGKFLRPADQDRPVLVWHYAADAWAAASCSNPLEEAKAQLEQFTDWVRYESTPFLVPVRLQPPAADFTVEHVLDVLDPEITNIFLSHKQNGEWDLMVSTQSPYERGTDQIDIDGVPWSYTSELTQLCSAPSDNPGVCISATWSASESVPEDREAEARPLLIEVARSLELPEDVSDRSTWFDAEDAFP